MVKKRDIPNNSSQFWKREKNALADIICYCKKTSVMVLNRVRSLLGRKDVTNTCKCMRHNPTICGIPPVQWQNAGRSWRLQMYFCRLLCVRLKIDQLYCVNYWVIIHCLSVSCTKINHMRYTLLIWSSLQLTSKQWIITEKFTARADLFLKLSQEWYRNLLIKVQNAYFSEDVLVVRSLL